MARSDAGHLLIVRFSAIGDVAMAVPVVYSLAVQYPKCRIRVLSRQRLAPLFERMPGNVSFRGVDLKGKYAGLAGMERLYRELKRERFDAVADFHDVIRTKYLRWRFSWAGVKTACLDKGREGKRKLVRRKHKELVCQASSASRYAAVLQAIGYPVQVAFTSLFGEGKGDIASLDLPICDKGIDKWIGVAPFAAHTGKIYPLSLQEEVLEHLSRRKDTKLFLFGGGKREVEVLEAWARRFPRVFSVAGKLTLGGELALMSHLDVMLSMDSANMHLASLVNVPVVSVWGATHPYAGFMGWGQPADRAVQVDLPCRPCSVYGNKPCYRKDYACLREITPDRIVERIEKLFQ
ncbi:MAG: glycosyltransferase family 9 protein [Prevotellaceae bacterium]|nr:glycosyltransferase family 9 protein [Prevotellaceae bacterium]